MPKQRPKRKAAEIATQQIYNQRLYNGTQRHCMRRVDEEVRRLNQVASLSYAQMTPVGQGIPPHIHPSLQHLYPGSGVSYPSSGYSTHIPLTSLPYSPMGPIAGGSFNPSPMIVQMTPESPQKASNIKKMTKQEFEEQVARRLENKIEHVLGKVDPGIEILQREMQVKDRLRQAVAKRQARMPPASLGNSPSTSASIFYTPSPSPTPTSRVTPNSSSSAFTPVIRNETLTSKFLESAQTEMASLQLTPNITPIQSAYSNILLGGSSGFPTYATYSGSVAGAHGVQLPSTVTSQPYFHLPAHHQIFYTGSVPPY
ncbi:Oidioi.mRNA.OKI2018_I69.XSR.g14232.t1.cds [Oikopleura dioica]|uniref:Oidioi.mRNA.OKI2018_I69.XSR.g14232.t1.cds n=1 Tax=Oikopleura dioica TaxID=34765 RepID=A0ABN7SFG6_OIKDI|nr:Oidioi.mRNA.OKI2018_I69.XSR.g14232.t1.cds [Oikopleura dioica]